MSFQPEYPHLPDMPASHLPFSPCVKVGSLVFVSGQASVDRSGKIVTDTFEGEMRRSMDNLIAILAVAGCSLADVVQTRNYVDKGDDVAEFNRIYRHYFRPPFPARTTITDCFGGKLKFEIDCIAVAKGGSISSPPGHQTGVSG